MPSGGEPGPHPQLGVGMTVVLAATRKGTAREAGAQRRWRPTRSPRRCVPEDVKGEPESVEWVGLFRLWGSKGQTWLGPGGRLRGVDEGWKKRG